MKASNYLLIVKSLRALATDTACELDVLGHDGHALGVDRAQVGVLEEAHQVSLSGLLESEHSRALEARAGHGPASWTGCADARPSPSTGLFLFLFIFLSFFQ